MGGRWGGRRGNKLGSHFLLLLVPHLIPVFLDRLCVSVDMLGLKKKYRDPEGREDKMVARLEGRGSHLDSWRWCYFISTNI